MKIKDHCLDGVSLPDLGKKYGTPLYLYSGGALRRRAGEWRESFLEKYENVRVSYASKAFACMAIYRRMAEEGFALDVVSGGEIYTAMKAGFPMEEVEFNGNNKTKEELLLAARAGVGRIIVDSYDELGLLEEIGRKEGRGWKVLLRVNPKVHTDTHAAISTGHSRSKFGIPMDESMMTEVLEFLRDSEFLHFRGLQFHVGSQLFENEPYIKALDSVLPFGEKIRREYGFSIEELNIGGGFGISYTKEDRPLSVSAFVDPIMEKIRDFYQGEGQRRPQISVEPGRNLVGDSGITLYTLGTVKRLDGGTFVSVDGGMGDNLRPALYDAKYSCELLKEGGPLEEVEVVGRYCESGDVLIKKALLPNPQRGDLLVVYSTGAYHYSMANRYNRVPVPPVVCVEGGKDELWVKGETWEDVVAKDL